MLRYILFLLLPLVSVFAKPVIDLYDSSIGLKENSYERPDFIFSIGKKNSHVALLSDNQLKNVDKIRKKGYEYIIAYTMEPRAIYSHTYSFIDENIKKFDLVLTFDKILLNKYPEKCKFVHAIGDDVLKEYKIHKKTKLCSIIFSSKVATIGQKLRHEAFRRCKNLLDGHKGPDTPRARWIDPWLNDFCFSVIIENSKQPHYFSEKLTGCICTGTIPIYWGCPTIGKFFDMRGIIVFNTLEELGSILENLSFDEYQKRMPAIKRNFELVKKYPQFTMHTRPHLPSALDVIWPHVNHYFN